MLPKINIYPIFFNYNNFLSKYLLFYVFMVQQNKLSPSEPNQMSIPRASPTADVNILPVPTFMKLKHFDYYTKKWKICFE